MRLRIHTVIGGLIVLAALAVMLVLGARGASVRATFARATPPAPAPIATPAGFHVHHGESHSDHGAHGPGGHEGDEGLPLAHSTGESVAAVASAGCTADAPVR